jgi:hypothetical protein
VKIAVACGRADRAYSLLSQMVSEYLCQQNARKLVASCNKQTGVRFVKKTKSTLRRTRKLISWNQGCFKGMHIQFIQTGSYMQVQEKVLMMVFWL